VAGLAIIVVFLDRQFLRVLSRTKGGVGGDFFPFLYTALLITVALLFAGGSSVYLPNLSEFGVRAVGAVAAFLGSYSALAILNLTGFLALQGINRAMVILRAERLGQHRSRTHDQDPSA